MLSGARRGAAALSTLTCFLLSSTLVPAAIPAGQRGGELARRARRAQATPRAGQASSGADDPSASAQTYVLYDGSTASVGADGFGSRTDPHGRVSPVVVVRPRGRSAMGDLRGPDRREIIRRLSLPRRGHYVPDEVLIALKDETPRAAQGSLLTGEASVDAALRAAGAVSARPLAAGLPGGRGYLLRLKGADPRSAARRLRETAGVAYASPNWTVSSLAAGPHPIPDWVIDRARSMSARPASRAAALATPAPGPSQNLPVNFGLASSLQSHLNAGGVNAAGAFELLGRRFGQLPGQGVVVTNVSLGDLTDQAMADAGDRYVQFFGPTTVVIGGQRYIDVPSMPLIPAWSASLNGRLDPNGAVEGVDPYLGEVLLDFSVMAPLPHDRQRPGAEGSGPTDLLGIAPGAQYRLVVPQQPTLANIIAALLAAARQKPRPDVITASLGFGVDVTGYPGRYLEDDPLVRSTVRSIVRDQGIVVCIAANDGTRIFVPAAIGPDGGSAPTQLAAPGETPTTVDQVAFSTAPSRIDDSGAIDVGGSTLDDIFSAPPLAGGPLAGTGSFPETRLNGSTDFSSGFGSRVNLAAPSDNIPVLLHICTGFPCTPQMVIPVLNGGTSASAPMVAAAAAVAIQSGRLAGVAMTPNDVRNLLVASGRALPNPPQASIDLAVGRQVDVTGAVESILGPRGGPSILRLAVAHRQAFLNLGTTFVEAADPGAIDLQGPPDFLGQPSGQNLTGPITIAPDIIGLSPASRPYYALVIGKQIFTRGDRVFRLLPGDILAAAGLDVASDAPRSVPLRYEIRGGGRVLAAAGLTLTFGPSDGTYSDALPPVAPATVPAGQPVRVTFDLKHVRQVNGPKLVVSSIDHWNPATTPLFRFERTIPINGSDHEIKVPADAFTGGAGVYGLGIQQDSDNNLLGWFGTIRVLGVAGEGRPPAPAFVVEGGPPAYSAGVTRGAPRFALRWDASGVAGAAGAALEISAPGPTLYGSINTFTNQNGDRRDADGVDSGSVLWYPLPAVAGAATFDAAALGLPSSLFYAARLFATDGRKPLGAASPVSGLSFDDGLTPGGETINDFDIVPGGGSVVATAAFDAGGNPLDSALRPYTPSSGTYGPPFASDATGRIIYYMFGSDPDLHRTATIRYDWFGTGQDLESYDSLTGRRLARVPVDYVNQFAIVGGRVDPGRHRAALLGWSGTDFSDNVLSFDLAAGALGPAIFADTGTDDRGLYTTLDVDAGMFWGDLCMFFDTAVTSVDLDQATATSFTPVTNCVTGLALDQQGLQAYLTIGPIFAFPALFPVARYQTVDQTTLRVSHLAPLGARSPLFPVVDSVNGLLLVGLSASDNYTEDNNAMSAIGVYDARSGHQVALLPQFNFLSEVFGPNALVGNERGIQIDPSTRTGWTWGPFGDQVQQFSY